MHSTYLTPCNNFTNACSIGTAHNIVASPSSGTTMDKRSTYQCPNTSSKPSPSSSMLPHENGRTNHIPRQPTQQPTQRGEAEATAQSFSVRRFPDALLLLPLLIQLCRPIFWYFDVPRGEILGTIVVDCYQQQGGGGGEGLHAVVPLRGRGGVRRWSDGGSLHHHWCWRWNWVQSNVALPPPGSKRMPCRCAVSHKVDHHATQRGR
jgi:hypothetical protein